MSSNFSLFFNAHMYTGLEYEVLVRQKNFSSRLSQSLENMGDKCLSPFRCLMGGRSITLIEPNEVFEVSELDTKEYVLRKTFMVFAAFILFVPGSVIKGIAWVIDYSTVKARNRKYRKLTQQRHKQLNKISQLTNKFKKADQFGLNQNLINKQIGSRLHHYKDEVRHVFEFLNEQDYHKLAVTSKKNYLLAKMYYSKIEPNFYLPCFKSILSNKLATLPIHPHFLSKQGSISSRIIMPFDASSVNAIQIFLAATASPVIFDDPIALKFLPEQRVQGLRDRLHRFDNRKDLVHSFIKELASHDESITKSYTPQRSIIIRIREISSVTSIVFFEMKNQWSVLSGFAGNAISPYLRLFLRDIKYKSQQPKIQEYLTRLFNKEPCGNFPRQLNHTIALVEGTFASDVLEEGPRVLENGLHVIALA